MVIDDVKLAFLRGITFIGDLNSSLEEAPYKFRNE